MSVKDTNQYPWPAIGFENNEVERKYCQEMEPKPIILENELFELGGGGGVQTASNNYRIHQDLPHHESTPVTPVVARYQNKSGYNYENDLMRDAKSYMHANTDTKSHKFRQSIFGLVDNNNLPIDSQQD